MHRRRRRTTSAAAAAAAAAAILYLYPVVVVGRGARLDGKREKSCCKIERRKRCCCSRIDRRSPVILGSFFLRASVDFSFQDSSERAFFVFTCVYAYAAASAGRYQKSELWKYSGCAASVRRSCGVSGIFTYQTDEPRSDMQIFPIGTFFFFSFSSFSLPSRAFSFHTVLIRTFPIFFYVPKPFLVLEYFLPWHIPTFSLKIFISACFDLCEV